MATKDFEHIWTTECSNYVLVRLPADPEDRYAILEKETHLSVIIEDDGVYHEVVQKMIDAGVRIVSDLSEV